MAGVLLEEAGQVQMKIAAAVLIAPVPVQLVVAALVAAAVVAAAVDDGRAGVGVEARMSNHRGLR